MSDEEGGYAETDEPAHYHYCGECDSCWSHRDESCVGPRYGQMGSSYECPIHMGEVGR